MHTSSNDRAQQIGFLVALRLECVNHRARFERERRRLMRTSEIDLDDFAHVLYELRRVDDAERYLDGEAEALSE